MGAVDEVTRFDQAGSADRSVTSYVDTCEDCDTTILTYQPATRAPRRAYRRCARCTASLWERDHGPVRVFRANGSAPSWR